MTSIAEKIIKPKLGVDYYSRVENHPFQHYLTVENIGHSETKARSPQTGIICEWFHKTMKNESYDITFRR